MRRFAFAIMLALLTGCETGCDEFDTVTTFFTSHGTVYECTGSDSSVWELCWNGSSVDLSIMTTRSCNLTTRLWPRYVGCAYSCKPHQGCNAHQGCWCPP